MRVVAFLVLTLLAAGCGAPDSSVEADTTWVGTITTEGNVTTVVNESGSVWGGEATLVEEASIGVESGPDEYMLDAVSSVYADAARIYIVNPRIPVVRMYDHSGDFVGNLGRRGQGPGEFLTPVWIAGDSRGRVFVFDTDSRRINVYAADGRSANTLSVTNPYCCFWPMVVGPNDTVWAPVMDWGAVLREEVDNSDEARKGVQAFGADGPVGPVLWTPEIEYRLLTYDVGGREEGLPFAPSYSWAPTADGIVAGASDRYRFLVRRADGSTLAVERYWEPVPVPSEHVEWTRRLKVGWARQYRDPGWNWDGAGTPSQQPAFSHFLPATSGEIWVVRRGQSQRVAGCDEDPLSDYVSAIANPCWKSDWNVDAFGQDGRYLGPVERPPEASSFSLGHWFILDDTILGVVEDDAGTIMVKRYRLVLPGEPEH